MSSGGGGGGGGARGVSARVAAPPRRGPGRCGRAVRTPPGLAGRAGGKQEAGVGVWGGAAGPQSGREDDRSAAGRGRCWVARAAAGLGAEPMTPRAPPRPAAGAVGRALSRESRAAAASVVSAGRPPAGQQHGDLKGR